MISVHSFQSFFIITGGYVINSFFLSALHRRKQMQPPSHRPALAPNHWTFVSLNLLFAGLFALATTELSIRGVNRMNYDPVAEYGWYRICWNLLLGILYENTVEYYWHRMLHSKYLYARFHKIHHYYKSPRPFDDLYIHPLEAFIYYSILYAPPFLFTMHVHAFTIYMIIMGVLGNMDHSGIPFSIPGVYDTEDHAMHHLKFDMNYGFPFPYLDLLHGTYQGRFLGIEISRRI